MFFSDGSLWENIATAQGVGADALRVGGVEAFDKTDGQLAVGGELPELRVTRPSLEDVYLDLIGDSR